MVTRDDARRNWNQNWGEWVPVCECVCLFCECKCTPEKFMARTTCTTAAFDAVKWGKTWFYWYLFLNVRHCGLHGKVVKSCLPICLALCPFKKRICDIWIDCLLFWIIHLLFFLTCTFRQQSWILQQDYKIISCLYGVGWGIDIYKRWQNQERSKIPWGWNLGVPLNIKEYFVCVCMSS